MGHDEADAVVVGPDVLGEAPDEEMGDEDCSDNPDSGAKDCIELQFGCFLVFRVSSGADPVDDDYTCIPGGDDSEPEQGFPLHGGINGLALLKSRICL